MLSSSKSSDRPTSVLTNASETFLPTYFVCVQRADSKIEKKAERNQVAEKSRHLNNLAESVIEVKRRRVRGDKIRVSRQRGLQIRAKRDRD
ncbi:hypothetical protein LSTR_LSTR005366 [Laodelphax striatellus]|uniref:Uncharacterized protein n=1 Tax=Laodelphax striatellus TaxID=195883 RepID=A0A482WR10_LAOST|nr:hypothetical protein LSTR_LSTR005366 [Laodelphax striatellus]